MNLEKKNTKDRTLNVLLNDKGENVSDSRGVLEIAREFYTTLYTDHTNLLAPMEDFAEELSDLDLPKLAEEDREALDQPFSGEELKKALAELNADKSPGSDGIPPEFYSKFWPLISPPFLPWSGTCH